MDRLCFQVQLSLHSQSHNLQMLFINSTKEVKFLMQFVFLYVIKQGYAKT